MIAALLASVALAAPPSFELRNTGPWFLGGEAAGSLLVGFVLPELVAPAQGVSCDTNAWCDTNAFDESVTAALRATHPKAAGYVSHVFTVGLVPAAVLGASIHGAVASGSPAHAWEDGVIMLDTFAVTTGAARIAKNTAHRQRPAWVHRRSDQTEAAALPGQEFLSFFSADTAWAFSLAASGTTLAYLRGYDFAPTVLVASGTFALTGGVLRIVADMHWATDVLTSAAVGTAVGVGMPLLLHGRSGGSSAASVSPSLGTDMQRLVLRGRF